MKKEQQSVYHKRKYVEHKEKGICVHCWRAPARAKRTTCQKCYDDRKIKAAAYKAQMRAGWRNQVIDHYGGCCQCCGEKEKDFLTIEHLNGGGRQHRISEGIRDLAMWIIKNNFPKDFTILCANCNTGKYRNGGVCPHERAK